MQNIIKKNMKLLMIVDQEYATIYKVFTFVI